MRHFSQRVLQCLTVTVLLLITTAGAQAQFDKLKSKVPGAGGNNGNAEVESIITTIDGARVKFAYARITLSLADDVIRRQALRNSAKKSTNAQIEKDKKELEELDRSIAEKRKLLADLGRRSGSGKYDENTDKQVTADLKSDEEKRDEKKAMIDEEVKDKETNDKDVSKADRDNYAKLSKLLFSAAKQERDAVETAKQVQPRAQSAASNISKNPMGMAGSQQPKRLNEGMKSLDQIISEGPQHATTVAEVAKHLAKIGGVDLTDTKFQAVIVTDEKDVPTDW